MLLLRHIHRNTMQSIEVDAPIATAVPQPPSAAEHQAETERSQLTNFEETLCPRKGSTSHQTRGTTVLCQPPRKPAMRSCQGWQRDFLFQSFPYFLGDVVSSAKFAEKCIQKNERFRLPPKFPVVDVHCWIPALKASNLAPKSYMFCLTSVHWSM